MNKLSFFCTLCCSGLEMPCICIYADNVGYMMIIQRRYDNIKDRDQPSIWRGHRFCTTCSWSVATGTYWQKNLEFLKNSHIMSFLIDAWPQAALFSFPSPPLNHPQLVSHHTGTHIYFTNQCFSLPSASTSNLFPLLTQALRGLFVGLPQPYPLQQSYEILLNLSPWRVQGYSPKQRAIYHIVVLYFSLS